MAVQEGVGVFPVTTNDIMNMVEKIAVQNITAVMSSNKLENAVYDYEIKDGKVIEEAIIEMAKAQAYDKNAYDRAAKDPTLHTKYFNVFESKQFQTTTRKNDIRAILANKGEGVEGVTEKILSTLTSADDAYKFNTIRDTITGANFKDYSTILGGNPLNMKGVIFALRDMFNHLKNNNDDLTEEVFVSATPASDIRIVIPEKVLNLIDVVELANIFNLTKEELFGVVIPMADSDLKQNKNTVYVYDRKAIGRGTRVYEYSQEVVAKGLYNNHYLTVERAHFHNGLFKGAKLDCTAAVTKALGEIVSPGK